MKKKRGSERSEREGHTEGKGARGRGEKIIDRESD